MNSRARQLRARAELEVARAGLIAAQAPSERLTGLEPPQVLVEPQVTAVLPSSAEQAVSLALTANFGVRASRAAADAADAAVWVARSAFAPQVELRLEAARTEDAYFFLPDQKIDSAAATVRVRIPLFEGGRRLAEERAARAERAQALAQDEQARAAVTEFVQTVYDEIEGRRLALAAAEAALDASQIATNGTRRERSEGLRTTFDVLEAEQAYLDAELARRQAETAYFIARVRLADALGILTPELLN